MKAKSLSVFQTRLCRNAPGVVLVNMGDVVEGDDEHIRTLARNGLVEIVVGSAAHVPISVAPVSQPNPEPAPASEDAVIRVEGDTPSNEQAPEEQKPDAEQGANPEPAKNKKAK